jgi:hypothetical protein
MSESELLFWLLIFSAITSAINCIEIVYLIKSSKRTNEILEHPVEIITKLAADLKDDKEAQEMFFQLVGAMAITGFTHIQQTVGKDIKKEIKSGNPLPKKYGWAWPFLEGLIPKTQDAAVQHVVEQMI